MTQCIEITDIERAPIAPPITSIRLKLDADSARILLQIVGSITGGYGKLLSLNMMASGPASLVLSATP